MIANPGRHDRGNPDRPPVTLRRSPAGGRHRMPAGSAANPTASPTVNMPEAC